MAYFRRMQCSPNSGFAPSSRDTAVSQRLLRGSAFFPPPPLPGCPDASNTDFNVTVYNTSLVFYSCTKDFLINGRQVQQCNPQSTPDYSYGCTIPELSTCTAEPPTPHGSIVFKSGPKFRVYTCPAGYSFAAGKMTQVVECFFGVWEPASLEDCFDGVLDNTDLRGCSNCISRKCQGVQSPSSMPFGYRLTAAGHEDPGSQGLPEAPNLRPPWTDQRPASDAVRRRGSPIPLHLRGTDQRSLLHGRPAPSCQRRRPGVVVLWIRRVAVVYECDAWHNWASGQSVQFSQCVNGAWTAVDDTCAVSLALDGPPCSDEPRLPAHAVETKALVHSGQRWAVQYECELGYTWPRGRRLRETTCDGGAWTEIHHDCSLGGRALDARGSQA
nr:uncharacterized protein LOC113802771 [Penaeus vannamei]